MNKSKNIMATMRVGAGLLLALLIAGCQPDRSTQKTQFAQLHITSCPAGALLVCDGAAVSPAPVTLRVPPGEHLIIARKPGYQEAMMSITARAGERIPVELKLELTRGLLLVHSRPDNANVEINDVHYGRTPLLLPNFPLGRHRLKINAPGYLDKLLEVELPDRAPVMVKTSLNSDAARLTVNSKPAGALVSLDGAELGKTPVRLPRIDVGGHKLEIAVKGYQTYQDEFTVKAGDDRKFDVTLKPLPGSLSVHTMPAGARIYLNNQYRGDAPYTTNGLPPGKYSIRAELRGHAPAHSEKDIAMGGETFVELKLERNSGTILVSTEPPGVTVLLDGENHGTTVPRDEERISEQMIVDFVPEGRHTLQLTRQGYYDVTHTRMITSGQSEIIHEKMRARPVQFVPTTIIRTGQGPAFTFRGIIRERFANDDIKLEIEPGIFKIFRAEEILEILPISAD